ncbi:SCP-like protein, partial [Oesophagostomum dentatum]
LPEHLKKAVIDAHNTLREKVATQRLNSSIFGNLPGTKSMFKLKYDSTNEALATATIADDCSRTSLKINALNRAQNFYTTRLPDLEEKHIDDYYIIAVDEWTKSVTKPFDANATWSNRAAAPFANMIYYKTLTFGCSHRHCPNEQKLSISCVYGARPKLGEPLYIKNSADKRGCVSDQTCQKVVSKSKCSFTKEEGSIETPGNYSFSSRPLAAIKIGPLCETDAITVD